MGKCVSRQSTCPSPAHHQSVLTIALSQQDLRHAHKIWQQLTTSNEYIATTTGPTDEPTFYYHISRNQAQSETEAEAETESETETEKDKETESESEQEQQEGKQELEQTTVLHFESVYNHLDAPVSAENVIGSSLTGCNNEDYATCQDFLLHELAQTLAECQVKYITPVLDASNSNSNSRSEITATTTTRTTATTTTNWQLSDSENETEDESNLHLQQSYEGQTESKKHGGKYHRRNNGNLTGHHQLDSKEEQQQQVHTKGTAMSFGFRKKLNGTPKKFKKLLEGGANHSTFQTDTKDDNGNATTMTTGAAIPVQFEKVGVAVAQKTANRTGAANKRFGYRGNVPRPASAGLTSSSEDAVETAANAQNNNNSSTGNNSSTSNSNNSNNNNNGNGNVLVSNLKRRSKSAHAGRTVDGEPKIAQPKTLTFNLNQNTTIEYQRRQFFGEFADEASATAAATSRQQRYNYNNLANMHANVIVRPTPRAAPASFAKFTLQTVSLPRPEYPVAISLTATTPTTPSSSSVQSPLPTHATGARAKDVATTSRQHPLTSIHVQPSSRQLDQKSVKQLTNNTTRRGFSGSREISADSGIASMDMAGDSGSSSGGSDRSKRSRSRPRNLQMVMSGRHTFEVRDMDDPPSSESNSYVETLALPKLPTDNSQTSQLPLVGLVRSNTVLSRESYERRQTESGQDQAAISMQTPETPPKPKAIGSDDSESVDEEKLYLDSSTSEKSAKQQSISLSSSMSWRCQAGESLAARDGSSMSFTSSDTQAPAKVNDKEEDMSLALDDISLINTDMDMQFSTISSLTEPAAKPSFLAGQDHLLNVADNREAATVRLPSERPRSFNNALNESKFAELALANSTCLLLDDETSPTDSLVSSTEESEEAGGKLKKHKLNAELQQKDIDVDIDDISPVLDLELDPGSRSPNSPGTPTHASHSLSLGSDCGNLIDDEIADQPALLCNSEAHEVATDTPTLMETHTHTQTGSLRSLKSQSKARTALQQAIELSLRTPAAVRRAVLESAESLDTLSPCESICSDDLMMDFDMNSSVDSIDRTVSMRSRSGSDLHKLGTEMDPEQAETEAELLSQLECKGSDVMKELNSLLRVRMQRTSSSPRERISAKLPARATRLLNRSRLQDQQQQQLTGNDSDNSLRSTHSGASARKRSTAASRASTASSTSSLQRRQLQQQQQQHPQLSATASGSRRATGHGSHAELHSSSDDLMLYDKSFRNAMIQDVLQFKKQLLRLRRILQETETLNPFENDNVQLFAACGLDSKQLNDIDLASLTSSTTEDPLQELSDLRRQGQVDDRDRTIRLQRDLIEQLEAEKRQASGDVANKECISMATQTERTRPLAIGAEGLSRSKPEYTSYTTHFPALHLHCNDSTVAATTIIRHQQQPQQQQQQSQQQPCNGHHSNHSNHSNCNCNSSNNSSNNNNNSCRALSQTRRHTIISTTLTNYNQQLAAAAYPRRASIGWDATETATPTAAVAAHKPVRITLIGESLPLPNGGCHKKLQQQQQQQHQHQQQQLQQNGVKTRFLNGSCQSNGQGTHHYQPLYNSNKMTNPTVTIV
ncbi:homeobox protein 5 isoform X2 [Drosophila innubila]|uniref:homeobox protein 5 isoform X2 n=1 Tax=Drosophila innubila TaxID=198719 RepID=UPI00148C2063|nr:homeobox protein 5 isoform X2 [Drosophila innubila]